MNFLARQAGVKYAMKQLSAFLCLYSVALAGIAAKGPDFGSWPDLSKSTVDFFPGLNFGSGAKFTGKQLMTIAGGTVFLWDVESGRELKHFQITSGYVAAVAFSPGKKQFLTVSARQMGLLILSDRVRLWDCATGLEIISIGERADDIHFSPDGKRILTVGETVGLWDSTTGRKLLEFPKFDNLVRGPASYMAVNFSRDSQRLAEIIRGGDQAKVWDALTGKELCTVSNNTGGFFTSIQLSPNGKLVLTGSYDRGRTWIPRTPRYGQSYLDPAIEGSAQTWDAKTGKLVRKFTGHTDMVRQALFTSGGQRILTASYDGSARLWETKTGKEIRRFQNLGSERVEQMAVSGNGKRLITKGRLKGDRYGASLWDVESGREILQFTNGFEYIVGFSPLDEKFMVIKDGKPLALWDGASGKIVRRYDTFATETSEKP